MSVESKIHIVSFCLLILCFSVKSFCRISILLFCSCVLKYDSFALFTPILTKVLSEKQSKHYFTIENLHNKLILYCGIRNFSNKKIENEILYYNLILVIFDVRVLIKHCLLMLLLLFHVASCDNDVVYGYACISF